MSPPATGATPDSDSDGDGDGAGANSEADDYGLCLGPSNGPTKDSGPPTDTLPPKDETPSDGTDTATSTSAFDDLADAVEPTTEPADPDEMDHTARRQQRVAYEGFDVATLPKPLVECGCGECPDKYDPLSDKLEYGTDGAFADLDDRSDHWAREDCPNPRPMTLEPDRGPLAYRVYQGAAYERDGWTGDRLTEWTSQYGRIMAAERDLLDTWDGDETTVLLSLRPRPVEQTGVEGGDSEADDYGTGMGPSTDGGIDDTDDTDAETDSNGRRWVNRLHLDNRLREALSYAQDRLRDHLDGYTWEYLWVVSTTDSAATPHLHLLLWVHDPDDEITVGHVRPAVESVTRNMERFHPEDHPVEAGESDAAVVETDPPRADDVPDDQLLRIIEHRREAGGSDGFPLNTAALLYLCNQRPDWALKRVVEGQSTYEDERRAFEGAAIAWASPNDWLGSSEGLDLSGGEYDPP